MEFERTECDPCVVNENYLKNRDEYYKILEIHELEDEIKKNKDEFKSSLLLEGILAAAIMYLVGTKLLTGYILGGIILTYGLYLINGIKKSHKNIKEGEKELIIQQEEYNKIHNR